MLVESKPHLRKLVRHRRARLSYAEKSSAAQKVIQRFEEKRAALSLTPTIVSGYWPLSDELDIRPLLHTLHNNGWRCTLPAVVQHASILRFRLWVPSHPLETDLLGIPVPLSQQPNYIPKILFIPGVAFDEFGFRLGQGQGYYDLTLKTLRKKNSLWTIGVGFSVQMVPYIPREPHDQPLDAILTENFFRTFP